MSSAGFGLKIFRGATASVATGPCVVIQEVLGLLFLSLAL